MGGRPATQAHQAALPPLMPFSRPRGQRPVPPGAQRSLTRSEGDMPLVSGQVKEKNEVKKDAGNWVFVENLTGILSQGIFLIPVRVVILFTVTY